MVARKKESKKYYLIFICLLLSIIAWFSLKMSKNYMQSYQYAISFVNTPQDKFLSYQSDTIITVSVDAKGFFLLRYEFGKKEIEVDYASIATAEQKKRSYITIKKNQLNTYLIEQLKFHENLTVIEPSHITIEFERFSAIK